MSAIPSDTTRAMRASGVSLQQLRLFVTLAQLRNFTQAGNACGITQSAASHSIRELEVLLELRLFDRTTRQVTLTDTGRALLSKIAGLVDELESALRVGRQRVTAESGAVSIASSSSLLAPSLPALLASCRVSYPNISLKVLDAPQSKVLELVRAGDADLGVVADPPNLDGLISEALFSDTLCAIVPARHTFASQTILRWSDLHDVDLFLLDDDAGSYDLIARALAEHGATNLKLQRLTQTTSVVQMVAAGLGIGIQPMRTCTATASTHARVQSVRLWPLVTRTVMLVKGKDRTLQSQAACIWTHVVLSSAEAERPLQTAAA